MLKMIRRWWRRGADAERRLREKEEIVSALSRALVRCCQDAQLHERAARRWKELARWHRTEHRATLGVLEATEEYEDELREALAAACCDRAPAGWQCKRHRGHGGPCAAERCLR